MRIARMLIVVSVVLAWLSVPVQVQAFDFVEATPVGSWQVREELTTDHKGRQTVAVVRTSMVGKEARNGETHYWVEVEMQSYQLKKDKRKKSGDRSIVKVLVAESVLTGEPADVMTRLRDMGDEIIIQNGDQAPMRITGGGAMADAMLQAMGTQMDYDYRKGEEKKVTVPAGTFTCQVQQGSGVTEMKVMFKSFRIESDTTMCLAAEVPFGIVESSTDSVVNGDRSKTEVSLFEFGGSGAESRITGEPTEAPSMPNLFN